MKARLLPLYFASGPDAEFTTQVAQLSNLLHEDAEILDPGPPPERR